MIHYFSILIDRLLIMKEFRKFQLTKELTTQIKSEEQIKQQNKEYKTLYQYKASIDKHYDTVHAQYYKLVKVKEKLENEHEEKKQKMIDIHSSDTYDSKKVGILKHKEKKIEQLIPVVIKAKELKAEVYKKMTIIEEYHKREAESWSELEDIANNCQYTYPDKHKMLKIVASLGRNQEVAITGNGIVHDTLIRRKFINLAKNGKDKAMSKKAQYQVKVVT